MASSGSSEEGSRGAGVRGVSWRERETLDLLDIWGEAHVQKALSKTHRNIDIFEKIARQMVARGHKRTALECRTKSKAMRHEYKKVLAHNNTPGNSPRTCPFYRELHRIFRSHETITPIHMSRSMDLGVMRGPQRPNPEVAPGSEELLSHNLTTINMCDLITSTPLDEGYTTGTEPGNHLLPTPPRSSLSQEGDPDETRLSTVPNEASPAEGVGHTYGLGHAVETNPTSPTRMSPGSGSSAVQVEPTDEELERLAVIDPPARRIANERQRLRRVALLTDVANHMLRQSEREEENASVRHREIMEAERRRLALETRWREEDRSRYKQEAWDRRAFLEEARLARYSFHDAMAKCTEAILAAVDAFRAMSSAPSVGECVTGVPETARLASTDKENSPAVPSAPKRARVARKRDILDL